MNVQAGFVPAALPGPVQTSKCVSKTLPILIDFSLGNTFTADLSTIQAQGFMDSVQTIYADNSGQSSPLIFTLGLGITNQVVTIPPNAQGYVPVLQPNPPKVQIFSASGAKITIQLLNFFVPPDVWSTAGAAFSFNGSGALNVSDPVLDATVANNRVNVTTQSGQTTMTDKSGTITLGGTAQQILPANPARKRFTLTNPAAQTEVLQFAYGAGGNGKIDINPGLTWDESDLEISAQAIWAVAATTNHPFTCYEGT